MSDQLLNILKYALLALLYLFFARVLWAVWSEVRGPRPGHGPAMANTRDATTHSIAPADPTVAAPYPQPVVKGQPLPRRPVRGKRGEVGRVVISEPRARKGAAYGLAEEITVGRADTCTIGMPDDTFVSQLHARLFRRDGGVFIEDLGSTNGTFLNGRRITAPEQVAKGDRVQIGNTVFEAE